ncbi:MAG: hypothetical protein HC876_22045 [Chloroflexaceae bacterium]|nr:hypothetical protein [Chloroflexaceae bacterium]
MAISSQQYLAKGGKIRPSQIITTFGPGAVVDLPEDSVMIVGIDDWPQGAVIREPRLESALDVAFFSCSSYEAVRWRYSLCSLPKESGLFKVWPDHLEEEVS